MSIHSYHPDTHAHGLADDCERCAEHAAHPHTSLDGANLAALRDRIATDQPPRSENEWRAMQVLAAHDRGAS